MPRCGANISTPLSPHSISTFCAHHRAEFRLAGFRLHNQKWRNIKRGGDRNLLAFPRFQYSNAGTSLSLREKWSLEKQRERETISPETSPKRGNGERIRDGSSFAKPLKSTECRNEEPPSPKGGSLLSWCAWRVSNPQPSAPEPSQLWLLEVLSVPPVHAVPIRPKCAFSLPNAQPSVTRFYPVRQYGQS